MSSGAAHDWIPACAGRTDWNDICMSVEQRLNAAMAWLCRAQDASHDFGVARAFSLVYQPFFGGRGWQPSYPETTGYIIPTF